MNIPSHAVTIERERGSAVVRVRFLSEHRLNPLSRGLVDDLRAAVRDLRAQPPGVVVFAGGENFSCGAHAGELASLAAGDLDAFITAEIQLCDEVAALPGVTIAAIKGACIGNAAELALACDLRLARDDTVLAWPEVALGYPAPAARLARFTGRGVAAELTLLGERLGADRARRLGLVTQVAGADEFEERLAGLVARAAAAPPDAVAGTKRNLDEAFRP